LDSKLAVQGDEIRDVVEWRKRERFASDVSKEGYGTRRGSSKPKNKEEIEETSIKV